MIAVVRIVLLGQLADTCTHCLTTFAVLNDIAIRKTPLQIVVFKISFSRHDRGSNQETKLRINHHKPKDGLQNTCSKPSVEVTPKLNADWLNPNNEKRPVTDRFRRLVSGEK